MKKEYRQWKLDDWVNMFNEIYGEKNEWETDEELCLKKMYGLFHNLH